MTLNLPFKNLWNQFANNESHSELTGDFDVLFERENQQNIQDNPRVNQIKNRTFSRKMRKRLLWRLFPNPAVREIIRLINEHEFNYNLLLDESAILFFTDKHGVIEFANKRFYEISGYKPDEIIGKHGKILDSGYHSMEFEDEALRTISSGNVWKGEILSKGKNGKPFWTYNVIIPVCNEQKQPIKYLTVSNDITHEKQAKGNTQFFMQMLEHVSDAVRVSDIDGNVMYLNSAAFNIHSIPEDFPVNELNVREIEPYYKDEENWKKHIQSLKEKGNILFESCYKNPEGAEIPVEVSVTLIEHFNKAYLVSTIRNIIDRKERERIQKETELKTSYLLSNLNDIVSIVDKNGIVQYISPGIESKLGYQPDEPLFKPFENLIREKDKAQFRKFFNQHTDNAQSCFYLNGKKQDCYVEITIQDKTKDFIINGYIITCRDITEMQKNLIELGKQKEMYRLLSENNRDMICLHKPNGRYQYISPSVKEMLGFEPEELIGKSPYEQVHEEDLQKILDQARKNKSTGLFQNKFQYRLKRKDGNYIWVESVTKAIFNKKGDCIQLQSSTRDITEKVLSDLALKQSDKRYKELIKYSQALITSHDEEGRILSVNPVFLEIFNLEDKEVIGKKIAQLIPQDKLAVFETEYLEKIKKEGVVKGTAKFFTKNGEPVYLLYHNFKVTGIETADYYMGIAIDVTEQVKNQKELKKAKVKAEEAAKAKEIFLANMSHEIRTPLNGILGVSDLLAKTALSKEQNDFLDIIRNSGENLLVIINDILDLAKIESGELTIENTGFDLINSIEKCMKPFFYKSEKKGLNLIFQNKFASELYVIGDRYRLNQIISNLLNNAIKFTDKGSVTLKLCQEKETNDSVIIEFSVIDTGIGIPEEKHVEIFENFKQINKADTYHSGGTGLGLSIVKKLVEMMGGQITLESSPGEGTHFSFIIPFKKTVYRKIEKKANHVKPDPVLLTGKRILIAEDNAINQMVIKAILEGWNIDFTIVSNGKDALDIFEKENFDLVILDIHMPQMSGLDVLHRIRKNPDTEKANKPLIALTANAFKGQKEQYLNEGMDNYLSKPFKEQELFNVITETLRLGKKEKPKHPIIQKDKLTLPVKSRQSGKKVKPQNEAVNTSLKESAMVEYKMDNVNEITGNDEALLKQIIGLFISTVPETLQEFNQSVENKDWTTAGAKAHKLKGSIVTFDVRPTSALLVGLEKDLKAAQNIESVPDRKVQLNEQITFLIEDLKKLI